MAGEFRGRQLQGQRFRRQDLSGFDFRGSDIRGADFSEAILENANFSGAHAGLQPYVSIALVTLAFLLLCLASMMTSYASISISSILVDISGSREYNLISSFLSIGILIFFSGLVYLRGLTQTAPLVVVVTAIITTFITLISGEFAGLGVSFVQSTAIAGAISGCLISALGHSINLNVVESKTLNRFYFGLTTLIGGLWGIGFGLKQLSEMPFTQVQILTALIIAIAILTPLLFLSTRISRKAISGDLRYTLIRSLALACTTQGTSFKGANLRNANFENTFLKSTDFREASLGRVNWFEAQKIDQARTEGTYLSSPSIQKLATTKIGRDQNYSFLCLRTLNLSNADLRNASFIGTDLTDTDLSNADLTGAILAQAQLYRANLQGACLTGTTIQDWGISTETILDSIICDFVYMRMPTPEDKDPCRKPDNRQEVFKDGDFSDFMAPILNTLGLYRQQNVDPRALAHTFKTLDLYHHDGIDPAAAAIALKNLSEAHPEAQLQVVALEGRGNEKIRLQAQVIGTVDRSELSTEYFSQYQEIQSLPHHDLQSLLSGISEKDDRIKKLEQMVLSAMENNKFYVETSYNLGQEPPKKILILTANPTDTDRLRLEKEAREIQAGLDRAKQRDRFQISYSLASRPSDLRRALLDHKPKIVHFSGHGGGEDGLAFENNSGKLHLVNTSALAKLFSIFKDEIECVVLNACYSEVQAESISQHIDYVIGMNKAIGDHAAIEFAIGFYDAIGAGRTVEEAFEIGCASIELENIPEALTPVIKRKSNTDKTESSS
ncbi:pentapeptide repeat-containing protein [Nodosilinea sp. LEGE 07298]|uniref:pentapeptide repeat-containing protein n=1 Tax=Nodosilinea sp. LEGE 07298 TaxID=2777970 RepID=UPI00187F7B5E|nr:pentapeptide repeat-containing protein [Nodosilinea sp. LEGE 07298]MBE9108548.1 pentapeptide repeat-containing protein [Nodosilinea sp. LEGE 07298]